MKSPLVRCLAAIFLCLSPTALFAAELVSITPATYDEYVPDGKEVDAIYGDYALRNDYIVVVIGDPIEGRNANMLVRNSGGNIIDISSRRLQSDQMTTYYAGAARLTYHFDSVAIDGKPQAVSDRYAVAVHGKTVRLTVASDATPEYPATKVHYSLSDDTRYITIETEYTNTGAAPLNVTLTDSIRADRSSDKIAVEKAENTTADRFWLYDPWFGQAYVFVAQEGLITGKTGEDGRAPSVLTFHADTQGEITIAPGETYRLTRHIVPGPTLFEANAVANAFKGIAQQPVSFDIKDSNGNAVPAAEIALSKGGADAGFSFTRPDGTLTFDLPAGAYLAKVSSLGYGEQDIAVDPSTNHNYSVTLPAAGRVIADFRDDRGARVPCKIQFYGKDGTKDPFFGPDSMIYGIHNVLYTPDGRAEHALDPGKYDVIVSYGPEYDAIFQTIEIA